MLDLHLADVSAYQPDVRWPEYAVDRRAVFVKATQGTGYVSETFHDQREGAHSVGLVVGLYHYAVGGDVASEGQHFLDTVGRVREREVPILDAEESDLSESWCRRWLDGIAAATNRTPILYCSWSFWTDVLSGMTGYPLWIAAYHDLSHDDPRDTVPGCRIWQFSDTAPVAGIGRCDDNVFRGTLDDLEALARPGGVGPPPEPPVPGLEHLHPTFAARVANACRQRGTSVHSGGRSHRRQKELSACYARFLATGRCDCADGCNPANRAGESWHEYAEGDEDLVGGRYALAVDFNEPYPHGAPGLVFPIAGEPWHGQPAEITETSRTAGADERLPTISDPPLPPPEEDDMSTAGQLYTLFVWGGGIWLVYPFTGALVPLHTETQVRTYLEAGALTPGAFDDEQFAAVGGGKDVAAHPQPNAEAVALVLGAAARSG